MKNNLNNDNRDALIQSAISKINEAKNAACAGFNSPEAAALWANARAVKKEQFEGVKALLIADPEDRGRLENDEAARVGKFLSDLPEDKLAVPDTTLDSLLLEKLLQEEAEANGGYVDNGVETPIFLIPTDEFGVPLVEPAGAKDGPATVTPEEFNIHKHIADWCTHSDWRVGAEFIPDTPLDGTTVDLRSVYVAHKGNGEDAAQALIDDYVEQVQGNDKLLALLTKAYEAHCEVHGPHTPMSMNAFDPAPHGMYAIHEGEPSTLSDLRRHALARHLDRVVPYFDQTSVMEKKGVPQ